MSCTRYECGNMRKALTGNLVPLKTGSGRPKFLVLSCNFGGPEKMPTTIIKKSIDIYIWCHSPDYRPTATL